MNRILLGIFCFSLISCTEQEVTLTDFSGEAMGSSWKLACRGSGEVDVSAEVRKVLEQWEQVLSQWREDSDLSRYNRGEAASAELQQVLDLAESIRQSTGGAFDHRILAEVHAAGFGPQGRGVDLSAIGKGFAVDRVGDRLKELGITDFIFELGGEILVGEGKWKVAIERPDPAMSEISSFRELRKQAMATSGNYRQFKPVSEGLAGHIIDPRTGKPVVRPPCSVTVIARDCTIADAWATALFVLGPEHPTPAGLEVQWNWLEP